MSFIDFRSGHDGIRRHARACLLAAGLWAWPALAALAAAAPEPAVIPNPATLVRQQGEFRLTGGTPVFAAPDDADAQRIAAYIADLFRRAYHVRLDAGSGATRRPAIRLVRDNGLAPEAYRLEITPRQITLAASGANGWLHAGATLWQLVPTPHKGAALVPALSISDAPRFPWRGIMLDSARHYQSPRFVHDFIDWMALHKLNVLHWHLTDDQAWRLEIRKYPELTRVGAWRVPAGHAAQADIDPATGRPRLYGGYYTQQTVRELVAYAHDRGITVVPEIEMPGHASAAAAAYPELGAAAQPLTEVPADWGIFSNVYSPSEYTFKFLEDVLTEVMALFPGEYIHVGGDEVVKEQWLHSPLAQARMQELGITDAAGLQTYFTQRIGRFLEAHGRRLVGWDEILTPGLPDAAVVMSWRGVDGALAATAQGHDSVLSPWPTLYFDNRQGNGPDEPPGRVRQISLEDVYRFDPLPANLTEAQRKHILGLQGNVWTEHIRTEARVGHMTFPRAAAIAELGWSAPQRLEWHDFVRRLAALFPRYDALALPHAESAFAVQANTHFNRGANTVTVDLTTQAGYGDIRYTLDGRQPTARSPRYAAPLTLSMPVELRAATFADGVRLSHPRVVALRPELAQRRSSRELKLCSNDIALGLEDDAPLHGPRAVFDVDIQKPCWIFPDADLDGVGSVVAAVGQVPFNFQIGEALGKVRFAAPVTPAGELEVHQDTCEGELLARLPLAPATVSDAVTVLPPAATRALSGRHDLCLQFAQKFAPPASDPIWVLDWIQLVQGPPRSVQ